MRTIAPADLLARIDQGTAPPVIDVRTPAEFVSGHVPGAINAPLTGLLAGRTLGLDPPHQTVVVYCGLGPRAWLASLALRRRGVREVIYLRGHWTAWRRAGLGTEKTAN